MNTANGQLEWKDGFLFLANELALDFLNTCPVQDGHAVELLPDFRAVLRWFRAANLLNSRESAGFDVQWAEAAGTEKTVESIRQFRERLRSQVLEWERGAAIRRSMIDELNRLMANYPMRTKLDIRNAVPVTQTWFRLQKPEDLFAPLAHSATRLFTEADCNRVRKCGQCVLHFLDTSKKGTRRWCSMQLCGNRLKVAAYAARRRSRAKPSSCSRSAVGSESGQLGWFP
jgi:predicted RNA-binding Zn ribbon-like protein